MMCFICFNVLIFYSFFHCSACAFDVCLLNYLLSYLLTYLLDLLRIVGAEVLQTMAHIFESSWENVRKISHFRKMLKKKTNSENTLGKISENKNI